jgi:allophanate hydrolase
VRFDRFVCLFSVAECGVASRNLKFTLLSPCALLALIANLDVSRKPASAAALYGSAIDIAERAGGIPVEIEFAPFRDAGRLLYNGPWVAERLVATERLLKEQREALLPVTRAIIEHGRSYSAPDAFRAQYELTALQCQAEREMGTIDCLLLPTTGTIYQIAAVTADPMRLNSNLGLYTSFANLLDLSALALPAGFRQNGLPFGISLLAPAFADNALLDLGTRLEHCRQASTNG